ncbi:MAG: sulfide/dihydroorotate dehydrogenase-like FAD/NAD-binding protein [Lachnospiraceae bacterium]|nr:sulfide/dihydroorotate dehydrogenase-like FAD/NAD-binding protein [Lachnospiraceae bacterium]
MYRILNAKWLNENIFLMDIEAKRVANRCQPGQFIIVRVDRDGERIPLTICDYDREKGSVTIVAQVVGAETYRLSKLQTGDCVQDFVGPLGKPSEFVETPSEELKQKKILFIAGGVGAAPVYPQVKWLKEQGVASDVILGARSKEILILEDELKAVAQNLYISTDDGSYGTKGTASVVLQNLYDAGQTYDVCVVIGPMIMMKYTCLLTKKLELPTVVSMNPIMVDGTGMCGACRLTVGNEVKFACVDGPEFDGHLVNFDEAMKRQTLYKTEEGRAYLKAKEGDTHHGGCGQCGGDRA